MTITTQHLSAGEIQFVLCITGGLFAFLFLIVKNKRWHLQ